MFKKYLFPILFFSCIIIASCITFNRNSYVNEYDFDSELLADDISLFDSLKIYNTKAYLSKQKKLLLIFKNDSLQYVLSNDLWRGRRMKYNLLENKIHLLTTKQTSHFERGGDISSVDSVVACKNIIISKQLHINNRRQTWNKEIINIYIKQNQTIEQYTTVDSFYLNSTYKGNLKALLKSIMDNTLSVVVSNNFALKNSFPNNKETEQDFFRNYLMHFSYSKK